MDSAVVSPFVTSSRTFAIVFAVVVSAAGNDSLVVILMVISSFC